MPRRSRVYTTPSLHVELRDGASGRRRLECMRSDVKAKRSISKEKRNLEDERVLFEKEYDTRKWYFN